MKMSEVKPVSSKDLEKNLLVKRINISKFNDSAMYGWVHSGSYNPFERFLIRKVLKNNLALGEIALDIGCGPGLVLREMCYIYEHCVGVDISLGILRCAKDYLKIEEKRNVDLLRADVEYMPFKNSAFDTATMYSVLHHLPNLNGSLKEINRVMTSRSHLILFHEPNEVRIRRIFEKTLNRILRKVRAVLLWSIHKTKWLQYKQEVQHRLTNLGKIEGLADLHAKKGFSVYQMRRLLEQSGFDVIQIKARIQSFMTIFSPLYWPYKAIAVWDFVLSEVPILRNYLPLLLCVARKKNRGFVESYGYNARWIDWSYMYT